MRVFFERKKMEIGFWLAEEDAVKLALAMYENEPCGGSESEMAYEVYIGCEEWQDITRFSTLLEAEEYVSSWNYNFIMGLYPARTGWIENLSTGEKTVFLETERGDE
jgi:hypothetical protein